MEANHPSVLAATAAVDAHSTTLGIEGDTQIQVWHLLASLLEYCAVHRVDFEGTLADFCHQSMSGEIELHAWEASQIAKRLPQTGIDLKEVADLCFGKPPAA